VRQPVIVRIRRGKAALHGGIFATIALASLAICLLLASVGTPDLWLLFTGLCVTSGFAGFALLFLGIALRNPVALRMDPQGISGFYCDPATWDEITDIGLVIGQKHHRFLGFTLRDPIGFRDRQSPWRRFASWSSGRASGHHIIVPELLLHDTRVDDLVAKARDLHAAHARTHNHVT
jgi:hypothetical protein